MIRVGLRHRLRPALMNDDQINQIIDSNMGGRPDCPEGQHDSYPVNSICGVQLYRCKRCDCYGEDIRWYPPDRTDYCCDLNAMHEVEATLEPQKLSDFNKTDRLEEYTARLQLLCIGHFGGIMRATARQRAIAFVGVLGLWNAQLCSPAAPPASFQG